MLKILRAVCAVIVVMAALPTAAQAQMHVSGDRARNGSAQFGRTYSGYNRFGDARYYGGVYRLAWRGPPYHGRIYRGSIWPARNYAYYRDWRNSYSPYWAWDVGADLLATAPAYYYGVGFGDEYGFEVPTVDDTIVYCVQRFRTYDPLSGTYLGRDGRRRPCP